MMLNGVAIHHAQSLDFTLISRTAQIVAPSPFQLRNTAIGWQYLKLQSIVPRYYAVRRACQFDHAPLILHLGRQDGLGKNSHGPALQGGFTLVGPKSA